MLPFSPKMIWCLLFGGSVEGVEQKGSQATLTVRLDAVQFRGYIRVHLDDVVKLSHRQVSDQWDEPWVTDPVVIAERRPTLGDVRPSPWDNAAVLLEDAKGALCIACGAVSFSLESGECLGAEAFAALVADSIARWRATWTGEGVHPLVAQAVHAPSWSEDLINPLLLAWRKERTSELATTIIFIDRATRPEEPPVRLSRHAGDLEVEAWCSTWTHAPGAALDELARCANETFDLLDDFPSLDERYQANQVIWSRLTRCVAALKEAPPDPRLGRALERSVRSPSEHWFRVDQVAHIAGPFAPDSDAPSFADHLFVLLAHHADCGTAPRLLEEARGVLIEADCNGAEMATRLYELAHALRERCPNDQWLARDVETYLWIRSWMRS